MIYTAAFPEIINKPLIILMRINYSCSKQSPSSLISLLFPLRSRLFAAEKEIFSNNNNNLKKKQTKAANPLKATTTQTGNKDVRLLKSHTFFTPAVNNEQSAVSTLENTQVTSGCVSLCCICLDDILQQTKKKRWMKKIS